MKAEEDLVKAEEEEVDWDDENQTICGVFICWAWPLNADIAATGIQDLLLLPQFRPHRMAIQLHGGTSQDISEEADKTFWLTLFVCEDLPSAYTKLMVPYTKPSLCRASHSSLLWLPDIRVTNALPDRALLSHSVQLLPEEVVKGIVEAAEHLHSYGSFPRANRSLKRHHNTAFEQVSRLSNKDSRPRLNTVLTMSALSHVLPMLQAKLGVSVPKWNDFGKQLLDKALSPPVFWLRPGLDNETLSTQIALESVKMQLMFKCKVDVFHSREMTFRTGLLYTPPRRKQRDRTSFVYIPDACTFANFKSSTAKRPIWIASLNSVRKAMERRHYDDIASMGQANYATSMGDMENVMRLQSTVTEWLDHQGNRQELNEEGEEILVVVTAIVMHTNSSMIL